MDRAGFPLGGGGGGRFSSWCTLFGSNPQRGLKHLDLTSSTLRKWMKMGRTTTTQALQVLGILVPIF